MPKTLKDCLIKFETYVSNNQFFKALHILESFLASPQQLTPIEYSKSSIKYSKIANILIENKKALKICIVFLTRAMSLSNEYKKSLQKNLIYYSLLSRENLANIYTKEKKYSLALQCLKKALESASGLTRSFKIISLLSKIQVNVSSVYIEINKFSDSLLYSNQGLETLNEKLRLKFDGKNISALSYNEKESIKSTIFIYILCVFNKAIAENAIGKKKQAEENFLLALQLSENFKDDNFELIKTIKEKYSEFIKSQSDYNNRLNHYRSESLRTQSSSRFFQTIYYSPEKLKKVTTALETEQRFISTDEFFYNRIKSELDINEGEKKNLKEIDTVEENLAEKKNLSKIRYRRHQKSQIIFENHSENDNKIQAIKDEVNNTRSKQSQLIKNKLKTRFYKKLLNGFNPENNQSLIPPQSKLYTGLFFKPPLEKIENIRRNPSKKVSNWITDRSVSQKQKELARIEIETFLYKLHEDLNYNSSKLNNDIDDKNTEGKLARSAQKGLQNKRAKFESLRESISKALFRRRTTTLPSNLLKLVEKLKK